jgi:hypothetical protein
MSSCTIPVLSFIRVFKIVATSRFRITRTTNCKHCNSYNNHKSWNPIRLLILGFIFFRFTYVYTYVYTYVFFQFFALF